EKGLDQLTKWARPGTVLLLTSDVHRKKWLKSIFRWLPGDALHPQQHTIGDYQQALRKRNWQIQQEKPLRKGWIFDYVVWVGVYIG
ncbi:MAG: hypothetical protein AAFU67_07875, partial [Bacteroidota bacterium]